MGAWASHARPLRTSPHNWKSEKHQDLHEDHAPPTEFHAWYFILCFLNRVVASVEVQLMLRSGFESNDMIQFADALAAEGV